MEAKSERNKRIYEDKKSHTYAELAQMYGISHNRVMQIIYGERIKRRLRKEKL
jgi:Mor family transcriptional regulator